MYHHVTDGPEPPLPHVTAPIFRKQMKYLKKNYRVVCLEEMVKNLLESEPIPPRTVALTFDDEYEDVYKNAFPVLKEYKLPATIFIATGFVDTDRLPWTDELGFLFKQTDKTDLTLGVGEESITLKWREGDSKFRAFQKLKNLLKTLPEENRRRLFEKMKALLNTPDTNPNRILSSEQIQIMARAGITFGAHTVNHPILTRIPLDEAKWEIEESKKRLEEILEKEVSGFCYPNGGADDFNEEVEGVVRRAGYSYACSTVEGLNGPWSDLYALKRFWTSGSSLPLFAARLLRRG